MIAPAARAPVLREICRRQDMPGGRVVFLIGCGKAKRDEPAPARELYTSPLFAKSLELAELVADATYVVSAAKGLIAPDERVTPYDLSLRTFDRAGRLAWARLVRDELAALAIGPPRIRVVMLMGSTYSAPLTEAIEQARESLAGAWARPVDLLAGMQIGERLAFLNRALEIAHAAIGSTSPSSLVCKRCGVVAGDDTLDRPCPRGFGHHWTKRSV